MREMKDSGVTWIGTVPSDYRTASIGSLFTIKKDIIGREPETVLSITQTGIRPKDLSSNEGQNASSYAHYQIVNVGDFAMNHMDLLTGWIDISKYEGVTSPDYRVFTLNDKEMSADYFLRVFQYYYTNKVFFGFGQGVATLGRWRLPAINFKKIDVPVPPVLEQQRIVSAIDEKVGKVDALIANVQAQIEKLKDYKQSVITEVVTKGMDCTVPMKDSGVEWIGQIPENYSVIRLRYLIKDYKAGPFGSALITDQLNTSGDILCYTPEHIAQQHTESEKNLYLPENRRSEMSQFFVKAGDVIFPIVGSLGRAMVITDDMPSGIINQRLAKFSLLPEKIDAGYFMWLFAKSTFFQPFINLFQRGSFIVNLAKGIVYDMPFVIPATIAKQKQISEYLDQKCSQIDRLIAIKQAKIEKLEQYKRSLIYEYVTGKRKAV